nr:TonB-dependent receptor [Bacteroidales bacterium]
MPKKLFIICSLLVLGFNYVLYSQTGTLKGKVTDKDSKEAIPFASIVIEAGGKQYGAAQADFDGNYTIKPIPPGKYDVKATYGGYASLVIKGVLISSDKITFQNLELSTTVALDEVKIVDYVKPLIDKDGGSSGGSVGKDQIAKMAGKSAAAVAATIGGVFTDEDGNIGGIRGARPGGTVIIMDGIRLRGSSSVPQNSIEEVQVITGGQPAQYGDATGGIINITTKGPSRKFGFGGNYETSELFDHQHYHLLGFNAQGPLILGKDTTKTSSLLGFFIAGELYSTKAGKTALDEYTVKKDVLKNLENNPLRPSGTGAGNFLNAEFLTMNDLEKIKNKENSLSQGFNLLAKIDVRSTENTNLTFGGNITYGNGLGWSRSNSLLNNKNNGESSSYTWRTFGRFTQRFPADKDSKSLIKNIFYSIQADYTRSYSKSQSAFFDDDLFKYGYIGKFNTYQKKTYEWGYDTVKRLTGWIHNDWADTLITFKQADINREKGNYTAQYYSQYPLYSGMYKTSDYLAANYALLNGQSPYSVYGLWSNTGSTIGSYGYSSNDQIGFNANGSADIKDHAIQFGIVYEQNSSRSYSIGASSLWGLMRQNINKHILERDLSNPYAVYDQYGVFQDTIWYDRRFTKEEQSYFSYNLRKAMGLNPEGTDFIDIDSYDINNHTISYYDKEGKMHTVPINKPLSVDMFNADELLNQGYSIVSYYGYDHTGKKLKNQPSFDDFFTKRDKYGNYTREIGAFQPIYMAGYIQDKFAFDDLIFNIGLRVDRLDLNQKVLKDPYLLFEAKTVKEVSDFTHPSSMGKDYVVYMDKVKDPEAVMGYRNGDTWYNKDGSEISDPSALEGLSGIAPYLVDPEQTIISSKAFKDYEPQVTYMPRISFSFPISDEALFFAHYDVLTKRPTDATQLDPLAYYYITNAGTNLISNPNLKPEKTIDYELGFQQILSKSSSLKLSAYYREMRDMVQAFRFYEAYPVTYLSFNNLDFGTVKGLSIAYDLRRTTNIWMNASYNIQFADGTGSSASSGLGIVASGQPNLRTTNPLSYDRRHEIKLSMDYRYFQGKEYNGPKISYIVKDKEGNDRVKNILFLENTGINLTFRGGSGLPYTARNIIGGTMRGSINGARLPWQFSMDARIDRDIMIKWKPTKKGKEKISYMNVYFVIFNVLNTKNVMGVYPTTGNADDDGYLSAAQNQNSIQASTNERSFRELYALYINSPDNYMLPR